MRSSKGKPGAVSGAACVRARGWGARSVLVSHTGAPLMLSNRYFPRPVRHQHSKQYGYVSDSLFSESTLIFLAVCLYNSNHSI